MPSTGGVQIRADRQELDEDFQVIFKVFFFILKYVVWGSVGGKISNENYHESGLLIFVYQRIKDVS